MVYLGFFAYSVVHSIVNLGIIAMLAPPYDYTESYYESWMADFSSIILLSSMSFATITLFIPYLSAVFVTESLNTMSTNTIIGYHVLLMLAGGLNTGGLGVLYYYEDYLF